jgi:hypothetical protein
MITKKVGTGKVDNRYNEERREGRRRSTWRSQLGELWAVVSIRNEKRGPPRSRSWWWGRLPTIRYEAKGEGKQQSTWEPWLRGLRAAINIRNTKQGAPKSRSWWLGGSPIIETKREQVWSAWTSNDSTQKLYQQHHDRLSSQKKKCVQNFGRHS